MHVSSSLWLASSTISKDDMGDIVYMYNVNIVYFLHRLFAYAVTMQYTSMDTKIPTEIRDWFGRQLLHPI